MKVELLEDDPSFKPFSLEVVIESKQEFEDLLSRLNLPPTYINSYSGNNPWKANYFSGMPLFELLSAIWEANFRQEDDAE